MRRSASSPTELTTDHRALPAARDTGGVPELPEVELVRRGLSTTIVGRRVEGVEVRSGSSLAVPTARLKRAVHGSRLTGAARRGKVLIVELDSGAHLLLHPMMTGRFVVTENGRTLFAGGHPSRSRRGSQPGWMAANRAACTTPSGTSSSWRSTPAVRASRTTPTALAARPATSRGHASSDAKASLARSVEP